MTESDRDPEISRRYRELAREEPPRALDEAILAAARRELETYPAPLVAPTGRRRWTVPVAAAAVIVLSAVVTLQIQREQPDAELIAPAAPPVPQRDDLSAAAPPAEAPRTEALRDAGVEQKAAEKPQAAERRRAQEPSLASRSAQSKPPSDPAPFAPDPPRAAPPAALEPQLSSVAPAAKPTLKPAPRAAEAAGTTLGAAAPAATDARSKRAEEAEPPERTLARIVVLRREGRHKEANDLYAEFRRRFPEYRIPETMREQVLPR
jgi:hypothetical protein